MVSHNPTSTALYSFKRANRFPTIWRAEYKRQPLRITNSKALWCCPRTQKSLHSTRHLVLCILFKRISLWSASLRDRSIQSSSSFPSCVRLCFRAAGWISAPRAFSASSWCFKISWISSCVAVLKSAVYHIWRLVIPTIWTASFEHLLLLDL